MYSAAALGPILGLLRVAGIVSILDTPKEKGH